MTAQEVKKCDCGSPSRHLAEIKKLVKQGASIGEICRAIGHRTGASVLKIVSEINGQSFETEDELQRIVNIIKGGNLTSEWIGKLLLAITDLAKKRGISWSESR